MLEDIHASARENRKRIILADTGERAQKASDIIEKEGLAELVAVQDTDDSLIEYVCERRSVRADEAQSLLEDRYWRAAAMVAIGKADGMVAGATRPTEDMLRAVLRLLLRNDFACSCLLMIRKEETFLFADCAMNPMPDAQRLAQIAILCAKEAERLNILPKVAMLSFSTLGSSSDERAWKVREAVSIAREAGIDVEGELQFDAAYVPEIGKRKGASGERANIYIFPSLDAANIACKMAERLGGFRAIGPIMLGLEKPANDLSRGCSVQDIVDVVALTAVQAQRT